MANKHFTVPTACVDSIGQLNNALDSYQQLVLSWAGSIPDNGIPADMSCFLSGLDLMFQPIIEGYRDIQSHFQKIDLLSLDDEND
jgi:hypothetical protein